MKGEHRQVDSVPGVVADVFERGSGVPAALQRLGAWVKVEPLAAGDYRIGGGVLVERKTVADLHGSLGRGRLWAQVGRIRDDAVLPFLLVEGSELDVGPRHPNAIRGALLAIAGSQGRDLRTLSGQTPAWSQALTLGAGDLRTTPQTTGAVPGRGG